MSERITGNSDLTKLEIQPGKFPSTPRPSDMTSFPVKGSAFSCVTKNAAVPAGKDLFPGNSRNWSERWNFLSLIDIPRVLEASVVCGFHLLNRKEKETGTGQVTSPNSLRYPRIPFGNLSRGTKSEIVGCLGLFLIV